MRACGRRRAASARRTVNDRRSPLRLRLLLVIGAAEAAGPGPGAPAAPAAGLPRRPRPRARPAPGSLRDAQWITTIAHDVTSVSHLFRDSRSITAELPNITLCWLG